MPSPTRQSREDQSALGTAPGSAAHSGGLSQRCARHGHPLGGDPCLARNYPRRPVHALPGRRDFPGKGHPHAPRPRGSRETQGRDHLPSGGHLPHGLGSTVGRGRGTARSRARGTSGGGCFRDAAAHRRQYQCPYHHDCRASGGLAARRESIAMIKAVRNRITDLRGVSRMAISAIAGVVSLVETLHLSIAKKSSVLAGPLVSGAIEATTAAVYKSIHHVTRAVGAGLDQALGALGPALRELESSPLREAVVAALNGVLGDHLAESGNPLAIAMHLRRDGKPLVLTSEGIAAAVAAPSGKVLVLVHGLCMNDLFWERNGHDHGAALARDLGFTAVYLHYNSGLHVSTNGRQLAALLDELIAAWPVPIVELDILTHSMGGLVVRSGHHYASAAARAWPGKLRKIIFLGTPHDGVPLERIGHWLNLLWDRTIFTAPFARLGKVRSAGITDLRHGYVLDEDWQGRDRFAKDSGRSEERRVGKE